LEDDTPSDVIADLGLTLPPRDVLIQIYERSAELAGIEVELARLAEEMQRLNDDRSKLAQDILPGLFDRVHTDHFGVPGWSADIVLEPVIHAAIKKDWTDEAQEAGFAELERLHGGDMVRVTLSVSFDKRELELAEELRQYIKRWNRWENRDIRMEKTVAWNTLTKFVGDMVRKRVPMDLQKLGAKVYRQCRIVWRKDKRGDVQMTRLNTAPQGD
jgi:hypothetical protein